MRIADEINQEDNSISIKVTENNFETCLSVIVWRWQRKWSEGDELRSIYVTLNDSEKVRNLFLIGSSIARQNTDLTMDGIRKLRGYKTKQHKFRMYSTWNLWKIIQ